MTKPSFWPLLSFSRAISTRYVLLTCLECFLAYIDFFPSVLQSIREPYKNWAEGHIAKVSDILNGARAEHTEAVKERIQSVEQMKDVVSITEGLFALSKVCIILNSRN